MPTCPGQDHRRLTVRDVACPGCGRLVEMFSDELRVRCPGCRTMVYQEQMPGCVQWCRAARDCVGPAKYEELVGGGTTASRGEETGPGPAEEARPGSPTGILRGEHRLIRRALELAREEADRVRPSGSWRPERLEKLLGFFRDYADRFHHAKEEAGLFVRLERLGFPVEGGPVGVMLAEHREFRKRTAAAAEALPRAARGDEDAREALAENLSAYVEGLTAHMRKEDEVLYPLADRVLDRAAREELAKEFAAVEREFGREFASSQRRMLVELSRL